MFVRIHARDAASDWLAPALLVRADAGAHLDCSFWLSRHALRAPIRLRHDLDPEELREGRERQQEE